MVASDPATPEDIVMEKNKHMDLDCRITIELELRKGTSFKGIAALLGKDCTTISKEIRRNIFLEKKGLME